MEALGRSERQKRREGEKAATPLKERNALETQRGCLRARLRNEGVEGVALARRTKISCFGAWSGGLERCELCGSALRAWVTRGARTRPCRTGIAPGASRKREGRGKAAPRTKMRCFVDSLLGGEIVVKGSVECIQRGEAPSKRVGEGLRGRRRGRRRSLGGRRSIASSLDWLG